MRRGSDVRVVAGAAATLTWGEFDQDGEPTNETTGTAPTVTVTRLDGTTVSTGSATDATTHWSYDLTAAQTEQVDELTVTWDTGDVEHTKTVSVVGGVYCSLAAARANDAWFNGNSAPSSDRLQVARRAAEAELEWITERAFAARADRVTLTSTGCPSIALPDWDLRSVRYVATVDTSGTETEYTGGVRVDAAGIMTRVDGSCWPCTGTVVVEYTFGAAGMAPNLREMFVRRWKYWASVPAGKHFGRTETWTAGEGGGTIRFAATTARKTGDVDVDAAYEQETRRTYGLA